MNLPPLIYNQKKQVYNFDTNKFVGATTKRGKEIIETTDSKQTKVVDNAKEAKQIMTDFSREEDIQVKITKKRRTGEMETQIEPEKKQMKETQTEPEKKQMKETQTQTFNQIQQTDKPETDLDKLLKVLIANLVKKPEINKSITQPEFSEIKDVIQKISKPSSMGKEPKPKPKSERRKDATGGKPVKEITIKGKKCKCKD